MTGTVGDVDDPSRFGPMPEQSYDYVIVGAGSAGAVLAARLTEDPKISVLLLEAGGETDGADEVSVPAAFSSLFKTRWDWNYSTTEQKQLHGRRAYWPRMKALGGCSSMNAMIYIRGNRADYDSWRDQYGATGWGYDDVLPYFVRSEGNTRLGAPLHGRSGPLHVEDRVYTHELSHAFVDSAVSAGMKPTDDFNGAEQEGAGLYQVTCRKGRRWSTNDAYLKPARSRPNLTVDDRRARRPRGPRGRAGDRRDLPAERSRAQRHRRPARWSSAAARSTARSCSCCRASARRRTSARSASTCGSTWRASAPTCRTTRSCRCCGTRTAPRTSRELNNVANFARWKARGTGPLASNIGEAGAFFASRDGLAAPDLQIHVAPSGFYDNGLHEPNRRMVTAAPTLVSVASRGHIRLRSADPGWHPEIEAAYFEDQVDLDAMLAGLRRTWEICTQGALGGFVTKPWNLPDSPVRRGPGRARPDLGPDALPPDLDLRDGHAARTPSSTRTCGSAASAACASPTPR